MNPQYQQQMITEGGPGFPIQQHNIMPNQDYGWPTPQMQPIEQPLKQPIIQSPETKFYGDSLTFTLDQRSKNLLPTIPEMYHDFLINYGIKLVAETELYEFYLDPRIETREADDDLVTETRKEKVKKKEVDKKEPEVPSVNAAGISAGFSSWG